MDYPKGVPGVGLINGKFVDENKVTGQIGSLIPSAWANALTDEVLNVVREAKITPTETSSTQLREAITKLTQAPLGYTPVQQGTGVGQGANAIKIGWSSQSKLKATVDTKDLGNFVFDNQLTDYATQQWVASNYAKLGYASVQQGTGMGQTSNVVKIGWSTQGKLKATVDATRDLGNFVFESQLTDYATQQWVASNYVKLGSVQSINYAHSAGSVNGVSNPATARGRVQWDSAIREIGPISSAYDFNAPWVVVGVRAVSYQATAGGVYIRAVLLRNQ